MLNLYILDEVDEVAPAKPAAPRGLFSFGFFNSRNSPQKNQNMENPEADSTADRCLDIYIHSPAQGLHEDLLLTL